MTRTSTAPGRRRARRRLGAALLLPALLSPALAACGQGEDPAMSPAGTTSSASAGEGTGTGSASPAASEPTAVLEDVPVYWVGASATDAWLYREFRDVPDVGGEAGRVASAVAAMTREEPLDPDYTNPWEPASRVSVTQDGEALAVDLSADALSGTDVGSPLAELAVQQLVWTATAAAQTSGPVTITVDGEPADAWGAVRLGEPVDRAPQGEVQAPVWVTEPQQDQRLPAGPVGITGVSTAFEGTVLWEITDASGAVVSDGFTTGGANGTYDEFSVQQPVQAGTCQPCTVSVWAPDESGGESGQGPRPFVDTKVFWVD